MKSFKEFNEESEGPLNRAEIAKRRFSDQRSKSKDKETKKRQLDNKKKGINTFNTQRTKLNTTAFPKEKPQKVIIKREIIDKTDNKTKKKEKE